jgi:hypothetical protein
MMKSKVLWRISYIPIYPVGRTKLTEWAREHATILECITPMSWHEEKIGLRHMSSYDITLQVIRSEKDRGLIVLMDSRFVQHFVPHIQGEG